MIHAQGSEAVARPACHAPATPDPTFSASTTPPVGPASQELVPPGSPATPPRLAPPARRRAAPPHPARAEGRLHEPQLALLARAASLPGHPEGVVTPLQLDSARQIQAAPAEPSRTPLPPWPPRERGRTPPGFRPPSSTARRSRWLLIATSSRSQSSRRNSTLRSRTTPCRRHRLFNYTLDQPAIARQQLRRVPQPLSDGWHLLLQQWQQPGPDPVRGGRIASWFDGSRRKARPRRHAIAPRSPSGTAPAAVARARGSELPGSGHRLWDLHSASSRPGPSWPGLDFAAMRRSLACR